MGRERGKREGRGIKVMVVSMMIVAVAVIAAVVLLARTEKIISSATIDGKGMLDEGRRGKSA